VVGEVQKLSLAQQQALRAHKLMLLEMLPTTCFITKQGDDYANAEREAIHFADTAEALKPLCDAIEYFQRKADRIRTLNPEATAQIVLEPELQQEPCRRCGSRKTYLAIIHAGESLRRDCAQCGRFIDFPSWNKREETADILARTIERSRYNKTSCKSDANALASSNECPF
jgi:hypothetical protein